MAGLEVKFPEEFTPASAVQNTHKILIDNGTDALWATIQQLEESTGALKNKTISGIDNVISDISASALDCLNSSSEDLTNLDSEIPTTKIINNNFLTQERTMPCFQRNIAGNIHLVKTARIASVDYTQVLRDVYAAFKVLHLDGTTAGNIYKLGWISRNDTAGNQNYRLRIYEKAPAGAWTLFIDTGPSFTLTENANGYSSVVYSTTGKKLTAEIDYRLITNHISIQIETDTTDEPLFLICPSCTDTLGAVNPVTLTTSIANTNTVVAQKADKELSHYNFERFDSSTYLSSTLISGSSVSFGTFFNIFKSLKLYGFDKTKPHKIRYFGRNAISNKYRIIISVYSESSWSTAFDNMITGGYLLTEASGYTEYNSTVGTKRVHATINYNAIPSGFSFNIWDNYNGQGSDSGQNTPGAIIAKHCFDGFDSVSGTTFNQNLNTNDSVQFAGITTSALMLTGTFPTGTLETPPTVPIGSLWLDITVPANPAIRVRVS